MSEWFLKEAEKFLDEARECGVNAFTITGGEPMLQYQRLFSQAGSVGPDEGKRNPSFNEDLF